jgi:hypothetical protein
MIRNLIALVVLGVPALAGPIASCTDGTLASYIALGSDGCQLGVYRVFDFQEISPSFGADPISSSAVSIMSATGANFGSLTFSASVQSITTALESAFLYSTAGPIFLGGLTLDRATASGAGVALVTQEFCVGGSFSGGICMGTNIPQTVFQVDGDRELSAQAFLGTQLANIRQSIVVDAGGTGSAAFGQATVTFATPEPNAALLAASALVGLILFKRGRRS